MNQVSLSDVYWFQEGPGVRNWQFKESGIKLLNVANITKQGKIDLDKTDRHLSTEEVDSKYQHFLIDEGDLVIASSGITNDEDNLLRTKIAFIEKQHLPLCLNTSTIRFKAKDGVSDLKFLKHWLNSLEFRQQITKEVTGIAQKNFGPSHLKKIKISLPPLTEQRRIASILDQADELRQKRQQAIEKLDQLLQATFIDMFGDPVSNPKGFEVKKLSEQVDLIQIGPFGTQLHQEDYIENGIPLINPSHIKNGKIIPNHKLTVSQSKYEELTQYHLRLNDVLLGRRGEMGRCAVVTENEVGWLCGTGSLFLRPNLEKINPFFLELLLSSDSIKRYLENVSQGQTMANLNKTIVGSIPLISPSIEIQNKFFLIAEKIDKMKTELKSAKNQVNNLFSSLQNQAFNGTL